MLKNTIVILLICISATSAFSQKLKNALEDEAFHNTLYAITSKFDAVVLLDTGQFWNENMKLSGIGFMKDIPYKLTIVFQKDTSAAQNLTLFRVSKAKVKEDRLPMVERIMDLNKIAMLNDDSLNIKAAPGETYAYKSGGRTWTLIGIEPASKKLSHVQSYMPKFYQERYATDDRAELIKTVMAIREIYRKKK